jgi:hypothetical protein
VSELAAAGIVGSVLYNATVTPSASRRSWGRRRIRMWSARRRSRSL